MKFSKLNVAVTAILGAGFSAQAMAIELYVDTQTQQLFAQPGAGRVKLGTFEKVEDVAESRALQDKVIEEKISDKIAKHQKAIESAPGHSEIKMTDKGMEIETKDGNFKMAINGRMQVDAQTNISGNGDVANPTKAATPNDTDYNLADGANIRRARLGVEGTFYKDWDYKFEYDFSRGNGSAAAGITDAYINWKGLKNCDPDKAGAICTLKWLKPLNFKVGSYKEPFSLEEATSNRWLTFIERNMAVNAFSDNPNAYRTGLAVNYAMPRWTVTGSIQTEPVGAGWSDTSSINGNGNNNRNNGAGDTGWDLTGRVTALPWFAGDTQFLHVGVSGSKRWVNNNNQADGDFNNGGMAFNAAVNSNVDRTSILNTGPLSYGNVNSAASRRVDSITRFGGEAALVYGPFSAQAEYLQADITGKGYSQKESLNGYYGYVSYFLTGESRAYKAKTGAWDRMKPTHNFDMKGGWGAWEVAAGYDYLDLSDGDVQGGRASTAKFGVNWYPNSHLKFMANLVHVLNIETNDVLVRTASGGTDAAATARSKAFNNANMDIAEFRAQVDW